MRLEGKVAVVSGGAKGIGLAIAERFAAEGATVYSGDLDFTEAGTGGSGIRQRPLDTARLDQWQQARRRGRGRRWCRRAGEQRRDGAGLRVDHRDRPRRLPAGHRGEPARRVLRHAHLHPAHAGQARWVGRQHQARSGESSVRRAWRRTRRRRARSP
nr:hypothetical protein [Angustibacter aerolatus]